MPTNSAVSKLTLNLSPRIADQIKKSAKDKGITVTEYIRRALATQIIIDKAIDEKGDLKIVTRNGDETIHQLDATL